MNWRKNSKAILRYRLNFTEYPTSEPTNKFEKGFFLNQDFFCRDELREERHVLSTHN